MTVKKHQEIIIQEGGEIHFHCTVCPRHVELRDGRLIYHVRGEQVEHEAKPMWEGEYTMDLDVDN